MDTIMPADIGGPGAFRVPCRRGDGCKCVANWCLHGSRSDKGTWGTAGSSPDVIYSRPHLRGVLDMVTRNRMAANTNHERTARQ